MNKLVGFWMLFTACFFSSFAQVDTAFIYNTNMPYGTLDIRIAKSASNYYYLKEGETFSFRESAPGVKTNTFRDMTAWDSSPFLEGNLREKSGSGDNFRMNYRFLKPNNYDPSFAEGYPLVIMFHGAGERANCLKNTCYHADRSYTPQTNSPAAPTDSDHKLLNNDHNLLHGGKVHLDARNLAGNKLPNDQSMPERAFPGFILFPQNLNGWDQTAVQDAIRIVRLMIRKYNINEDRVYIHGLSNGGHGVYEAIKRAPWLFASAMAMSAIDDGFIIQQGMAPKIAHIPLWLFQGGLDENPFPAETERYVRTFREVGASVRYTFYPHLGHGTWNDAYKEPDFFTWMLGKRKSSIHVFAESPAICENSQEGVRLEVAEGFKAYQWEFNSQVIAGATAYFYNATEPGKYRVRFSRVSASPGEGDWNTWSDVVEVKQQEAPKAEIRQIGTVLLRDLNGFPDARLESAQEAAHYYWYKNDQLIDLPGNQDDTIRSITIKPGACTSPCTNNGVYTLVTSSFDNCKSVPSAAKYVFFEDQAPVNIKTPLSFRGAAASPSSIILIWIDVSNNENGFEIWRRKKSGDGTLSAWEMATLTEANANSYKDVQLEPSTIYQYKIRAVSNEGRSEYTPAEDRVLEVKTSKDTSRPSPPEGLRVTATAIQTLTITWQPSRDNAGIREYRVTYGDNTAMTSDTVLVLKDLPLNTVYPINVTAIDIAGNESVPSDTRQGSTYVYGLFYEHTTGEWPELDSVNWSIAEFRGTVYNFTLSPKTQEDYFNFKFEGFLFINSPGSYQLRTISNDGSKLWLDNKLLVDNDGIHNNLITVTSTAQNLAAGEHRITVQFFEHTLGDSLVVQYKGPDSNNNWVTIPEEAIRSSLVTGSEDPVTQDQPVQLSVFPNPSQQHEINVQVKSILTGPIQLRMSDPLGRTIITSEYDAHELHDGIRLTPQVPLSNGMYVIIVNQGTHTVKQKLLIKN